MPRKIRVQYPGAIDHLMSRGDRREDIFLDDVDRQDFLKTLVETCQKTGFQVHAYCLMRNHFHLVVETPHANLVAGMAWLLSAYTIRLTGANGRPTGETPRGRLAPGECGGPSRTDRYKNKKPGTDAVMAPVENKEHHSSKPNQTMG